MESEVQSRGRSKAGRWAMLLVAVVAAAAVGGTTLAQASESGGSQGEATTATTVGSAVRTADKVPTEAEIEATFAEARQCIESAGIKVLNAHLSVTQYDVSTAWALQGAAGGDLTAAEERIDANCRGELSAIGAAWTAASGIPYEQLNKAVADCLAEEGLAGDPGSIATAESRRCVEAARQSVLGIEPYSG